MQNSDILEYFVNAYNCVQIQDKSLINKCDMNWFIHAMNNSLKIWKSKQYRAIWLQISIKNIHILSVAINQFNFTIHHSKNNYIMLSKWIHDTLPNLLPKYSHSFVGVGCVVINAKKQILLVQENTGPTSKRNWWKLPGGFVESNDLLCQAAEREVKEETGIEAEFVGLCCVTEMLLDKSDEMKYDFFIKKPTRGIDGRDLYCLCLLKLKNENEMKLVKQNDEISEVTWMDLNEALKLPLYDIKNDGSKPGIFAVAIRDCIDVYNGHKQPLSQDMLPLKFRKGDRSLYHPKKGSNNELASKAKKAENMVISIQNDIKILKNTLNGANNDENMEQNEAKISDEKIDSECIKKNSKAIDLLGSRMKKYEETALITKKASDELPLIVRLDGHGFSKFTKGFLKPFDKYLHQAMVYTTGDLISEYSACTGYTQSDEITLIWQPPNISNGSTHIFGGRILKISTLLSGFASVRFNYHLNLLLHKGVFDGNEYKDSDSLKDKIKRNMAHFDGRAFNVPNNTELLNNIIWRSKFDCRRNSVSALARAYYSTKQLNKKSTQNKIDMLKSEHNIDWNDQPMSFKFGTFIKKELYQMECIDIKTNKNVMATRSRMVSIPIEIENFNDKYIDILLAKYWNWDLNWINKNDSQILTYDT